MPNPKPNSPPFSHIVPPKTEGAVIPSGRWTKGAWIFRDDTQRRLEILLDEAFRIPFTRFRFGIDGIIGLVPGLGDVIAGIFSLIIPIAAWTRGVPYVALMRMAVNLGIGVLVGSIPLLGGAFEIAWKPNRRNYQLMQRHIGQPRRHTWKDWAFLAALLCGLAIVIAIPLAVFVWCLIWLNQHLMIRCVEGS